MYAANVEGRQLSFDVAGVWRRNMVIRDRQTKTIWQQSTGEAIAGPLEGAQLPLIGGSLVRGGAWREENPEGILATEPDPPAPNLMRVEGMVRLFGVTRLAAGPGLAAKEDCRLPLHQVVIGLEVGEESRAYPLQLLRDLGKVEDRLGGKKVVLRYRPEGDRIEAAVSGNPAWVERTWWLGWSEFHPHTDVYTPQN